MPAYPPAGHQNVAEKRRQLIEKELAGLGLKNATNVPSPIQAIFPNGNIDVVSYAASNLYKLKAQKLLQKCSKSQLYPCFREIFLDILSFYGFQGKRQVLSYHNAPVDTQQPNGPPLKPKPDMLFVWSDKSQTPCPYPKFHGDLTSRKGRQVYKYTCSPINIKSGGFATDDQLQILSYLKSV
ncbi:hypothetical protein CPB83DRAFT_899766 [Crepidotus variabilis]|uniref:Uncharacterized protein n=1 Tax=Crepidotus variabilis TaxID=179855 RepID=A0A9P6JIU8_9AGAR|nr:hypothetical protein CPB83DRAFT_899766 [Crepidotus variabilis]